MSDHEQGESMTNERVDAAYFKIASIHHLHDGRRCLCGFDSQGRARSATEHVLDEFLAELGADR